jgi:GT2 family glycosyltransferase
MDPLLVRGKFLYSGESKYVICGVTYGTFRPDGDGEYGSREKVSTDFALMRKAGLNSVRTYTVPPPWLLDTAGECGLRVMVGLPWEQHVTFLDDSCHTARIETQLRDKIRSCAGHPAIMAFAVGNEIPAPIVRWHGRSKVESLLKRLYHAAKSEDQDTLVTYVNYPTTEYLELPFLDFFSFNVYLECRELLSRYLAHLHIVAGNQPVVMAELGLDSRRNGLDEQANTLKWQVQQTLASGCAGAFIFSWTDEWHRGGYDIEDWDFGLVGRDRVPKRALGAVSCAFAENPFTAKAHRPRISVIVCSYNGARTIKETLAHIDRLNYPNVEIVVVDDGSADTTSEIASGFSRVRLIRVANGGLSRARNIGMKAAQGEILAYIDDDAYPDPDWLGHLAEAYRGGRYVSVGGPNIAPPDDGPIAECVSYSPGGPAHVMLTDTEAEHIPGCNFSIRRDCLETIGGFDSQFRIAGDDVDVCWRLLERGWLIGFSPAAVVWHHRRNSVRAYWKQQVNYGKAEALLERKWPQKYNGAGHVTWSGRVYGAGPTQLLGSISRIYHGVWGSSPFQALYREPVELWQSIPAMPEWYLGLLVSLFLVIIWALGGHWHPLWIGFPLLSISAGVPTVLAFASALKASYRSCHTSQTRRFCLFTLPTTLLHLLQPIARLSGRLQYGIRPWRLRGQIPSLAGCWLHTEQYWSENWRPLEGVLEQIENTLIATGAVVDRGQVSDSWDLRVGYSLFGAARIHATVEEHGGGKQMFRFRIKPQLSAIAPSISVFFASLSFWAFVDRARIESAIMLGVVLIIISRIAIDSGFSIAAAQLAVEGLAKDPVSETTDCGHKKISRAVHGAVPT